MSRSARCIEPGLPYHVTQRGTNRQNVFHSIQDRQTYLSLMRMHLEDTAVRVLAYCLMTNHVHLILVPDRADSLAVLFRRVHGAYAQSFNARRGRSGHLWQNRFYSCPMSDSHLWLGIRYVEANALRAAMVDRVEDYRWSSAGVHLSEAKDSSGILDLEFWKSAGGAERWQDLHAAAELPSETHLLRRCTYAGRPFGEEALVERIEATFQRKWRRWSFEKTLGGRSLAAS